MGEINRENQWPFALLVFILFTLVLERQTLVDGRGLFWQ